MSQSPPAIRSVKARAVVVPLKRPLKNAFGIFTSAPLVLIDVVTDQGVIGRAYIFAYANVTLKPLVLLVEEIGRELVGKPIVPFEMLSVLFQYRAREDRLPVRGPAVGLFADQEIRLTRGPLFVGESYTCEREVVALSGSRRTESMWVRTTVFGADGAPVATMLLNGASIKQSYATYEKEYAALYA